MGGSEQRKRPERRLGEPERGRVLARSGSGKARPLGATARPDVKQIRALQTAAGNAALARVLAGRSNVSSAQVQRLNRRAGNTTVTSGLQGARGSQSTVQRLKFPAAPPKVEQAKDDLTASIGGTNVSAS